MSKYLVTSFYTVDTPYEEEAKKRLIPSLLKHGIPHYVVGVKSHGDWRRNIYEKAETILNAFNRVPAGRAVVWLDADAEVVEKPALFETLDCDFAYHNRNGNLSSGTMYFGPHFVTQKLLGAWHNKLMWRANNGQWKDATEQAVLKEVLGTFNSVRVVDLPLSYSTIFDGPQPQEPVVIRHHQASRRLKGSV